MARIRIADGDLAGARGLLEPLLDDGATDPGVRDAASKLYGQIAP